MLELEMIKEKLHEEKNCEMIVVESILNHFGYYDVKSHVTTSMTFQKGEGECGVLKGINKCMTLLLSDYDIQKDVILKYIKELKADFKIEFGSYICSEINEDNSDYSKILPICEMIIDHTTNEIEEIMNIERSPNTPMIRRYKNL